MRRMPMMLGQRMKLLLWAVGFRAPKADFEVDYCYYALAGDIAYVHVGQQLCMHVCNFVYLRTFHCLLHYEYRTWGTLVQSNFVVNDEIAVVKHYLIFLK